jgi:hypothetical protein
MVLGVAFAASSGAQAQSNRCAIFGSGFVEVHGADSCVRIGGRVRVDAGIVGRGDIFGPSPNVQYAPGALNGPEREQLRVPGGSQNGMPRTR